MLDESKQRAAETATKLADSAEKAFLGNPKWQGGKQAEFLMRVCGNYVLGASQVSIIQELRHSMRRVGWISAILAITYLIAGSVQFAIDASHSTLTTHVANALHNASMALLVILTANSFSGVVSAVKAEDNCLPHLMLSLERLAVALSQFSAMAIGTAIITVVSATIQWPRLAVFASSAVALGMLVRMAASFYLVAEVHGTGSVVNTIVSIQRGTKAASWVDKLSLMLSASNIVNYPVIGAFGRKPRAVQERSGSSPVESTGPVSKLPADLDQVPRDVVQEKGTEGNKDAEAEVAEAMPSVDDGEGSERHTVPPNEYEFNDGEQVILQLLTDEMRMAGYNNVTFSVAVFFMGVANAMTGHWVPALLTIPQFIDTCGTAQVFLNCATQLSAPILTTGHDVKALLKGMGEKTGMTGLFKRVYKLSMGVVVAHIVISLWNARTLVLGA